MRKLPKIYENMFDNLLLDLAENTTEIFKKLSFSPNDITTLSNISCLISVYFIFKRKFICSCIFFMLAYFFDCLDGHYARKYKMVSKFGDLYDHVSDIFKFSLILYSLYSINDKTFFKILPVIIILLILSFTHLGCQEIYYNKNESHSLNITKSFCNCINTNGIEKTILFTKYFGTGTLFLFMTLIICFYNKL